MTVSLPLYREFTGDNAIPQGGSFGYAWCLKSQSLPITPFVASTRYDLYDFVTPTSNPTGLVFMTTSSGTAGSSEPSWSTATIGQRFVSNTASFTRVRTSRPIDTSSWIAAEMTIREAAVGGGDPYSGAEAARFTKANGRIEVGFDPAKWLASHVYAEGERIVPPVLNGYIYQCINGGTSGASTPAFYNAIDLGAVLTDGGVTWRCMMDDDGNVSNLRIALDSTYTATLDAWGQGTFSFSVTDAFSEKTEVFYGPIVLQRTTNY